MITLDDYVLDKNRVGLYFDKYKYKCTLFIIDIHFFRRVKEEHNVERHAENLQAHFNISSFTYALTDIKLFVGWREIATSMKQDVKIRIQQHSIDVYHNDISIAKTLSMVFDGRRVSEGIKLTRVEEREDYERGVIYRAKPKNKFRIYLKSRRYTTEQKAELIEFLREHNVKLSESFKNWSMRTTSMYAWAMAGSWAWDYLCFDYDDEYLPTIMALKFDGVIRKICRIEKK